MIALRGHRPYRMHEYLSGRPAEDRQSLLTRPSARLRHKQRAASPWDYERLVLEAFPHVFKVKCFPNMDTRSEAT